MLMFSHQRKGREQSSVEVEALERLGLGGDAHLPQSSANGRLGPPIFFFSNSLIFFFSQESSTVVSMA